MRSTRPFSVWLGILAVLMQLLLPQVHAAAYADRAGDPLAYALCGIGATPELAAELRAVLPAEVIDALDAGHAAPELPDCHACAGAHTGAAVQSHASAGMADTGRSGHAWLTPEAVPDQGSRRPSARAPPLPA